MKLSPDTIETLKSIGFALAMFVCIVVIPALIGNP
jgi:hypothetical protein